MSGSTKLLTALIWLAMVSSCGGPPLHSTSPPSDFHLLDESIGFKCSSNKPISVHMVCDKKRDCEDNSDEIYCIHQSVRFETNGTFGNGEKICTQVDDKCSCVQVTVTLGEDGKKLYELLKSIVGENVTSDSNENITEQSTIEENFTSDSNENVTEQSTIEENFTSDSNENVTEQSTIEENFTSNGNENITEQPIVEENSTYKSNANITEQPIVEENVTSNSNENITEKSTAQENSTSKSKANITENSDVEQIFTFNGNGNISEKIIVEKSFTFNSNENIAEKSTVEENSTSKSNENITEKPNVEEDETFISTIVIPAGLLILLLLLIVGMFIYFNCFRKPKTDTPAQEGEEIEIQNIGTAEETHEEAERFLANQPVESNV